MTKYGALLAVLSNLENEDYVKTVFGDVEDFVRDLQNVTDEELHRSKAIDKKVVTTHVLENFLHFLNFSHKEA